MNEVIEFLKGKKTYIVAACLGIVVALGHLEVIAPETVKILVGLLGAGGLASVRAGINKAKKA